MTFDLENDLAFPKKTFVITLISKSKKKKTLTLKITFDFQIKVTYHFHLGQDILCGNNPKMKN